MLKRAFIVMATLIVAIFYAYYSDNTLKKNLGNGEVSLSVLPSETFVDSNNKTFSIQDKKSAKLHYIHFWATWCAPCETELPELVKLINSLKNEPVNFYLVAVNDDMKKALLHMKRFSNLPNNVFLLFDNKNIHLEKYGTARVPETFVFNHLFNLEKKYTGPQFWGNSEFLNQAKYLLNN